MLWYISSSSWLTESDYQYLKIQCTLYNGTLNNISFPYNGSHNLVFVDTTGVQYPDNTIDL